jgi:hypothetical protein
MARKDIDMPLAPSAAIVDEQTQRAAMLTPVLETSPSTSPASVRRFEETGAGFPEPETPFPEYNKPLWNYDRTIQTANGPVDVDFFGFAKDGSTPIALKVFKATDGKEFTDQAAYATYQASLNSTSASALAAQQGAALAAQTSQGQRQSAYDLLYSEFDRYGLGSLVTPLKDLITSGVSPSEFTIRLRETDAYKKRFSANQARIKNGFRALSESEYIRNEDAYQDVMRRRGLPPEYYSKGDMGVQKGFEALLAGDVSSTELEDRIVTAQDRVLNANPEVAQALKAFYPGISNGDILAYALDPANAINAIKRKVTTAEIGGAAARSGLTTNLSDAEYLQRYGVTKESAERGYTTIAGGLQRGSELASIYQQDPYTQATAEQEIFNVPGAAEARKQRQKITGLEKATFGGQSGLTSGALARDRAGGY